MAPKLVLFSTATLLAASVAHAQTPGEVLIVVDEPVLAPGESTTVRLWAGFDSTRDYAMAGLITNLLADSGGVDIASAWSDVALVTPMNGPGTTFGTPDGGGYAGILAGQLHDPLDPLPTGTSDPIAFWEATFTAPTGFGQLAIELSTRTTRFEVYIDEGSRTAESRLDGLTEGAATIFVVPAPASALVLAGVLAIRRRR